MSESSEVPLSANAQEVKEMMHQQLMRKMANKITAAAIEEERQRRIQSEKEGEDDAVRRKAFDQLVVVQENLVRCLNIRKVSLTRGESLEGALCSSGCSSWHRILICLAQVLTLCRPVAAKCAR